MQTQSRGAIAATQPSNNPFASASLYVGDLATDVTEATLFELFNAVGPVASIRVCRDATTRRSLGYAYVNFHSVQDAERALDTMNFTNIRGKQCRIMWSQRDPRLRQSGKGNIFVKNLHESIDNKTLYDTFSVFGNILSCKVVMDRETGKSRGYGYVHYVDDKSAKKAIEGVNGMTISDRQVHAELFKPREERQKNFKFTNVYVKYIPRNWTEEIVKEVFEKGTGGEVDKMFFWRHDYGVSCCMNFKDPEMARIATEQINGRDIDSFDIAKERLLDLDETKEEQTDAGTDAAAAATGDAAAVDATDKEENKDDSDTKETAADDKATDEKKKAAAAAVVAQPNKLYVARAQKRKERKEYLTRQRRGRGVGARRNYAGANLYVKNLSPDVDDEKLNEMFATFGTITSAKVMREQGGKSRGFGFVAFEKKEAGTRAIHEMTNTLHHGKPLYVSRAQTKAFRQTFIMKQLRNKRIKQQQGGMGGGPMGMGGMGPGGPMGGQQQFGGGRGGFGPMGMQQQQFGQRGAFGQANAPPAQAQAMMARGVQPPFGRQMQGMPGAPMQFQPYGATNPLAMQQLAMQQQMAAQAQLASQQAMAQRAHQNLVNQAQIAAQQQMSSIQQQAIGGVGGSSIQMSSIQQQAAHRSASQQQSQPAQSMQSGPQSTSMYAGSASIPRPGLTASQQMPGIAGTIASQPHQSSVPTGQHSVSQLSAGAGQASAPMLEVNPLTAEMLQDAKPAEKKRLIGERLFPKIQVVEPRLAGKITGMLLEMDNTELLVLLSEQRALMNKINEALAVLKDHQQKQSQQNPGSTKNPSSQNPSSSAQN
eukprot:CAMPEP_0202730400 /NCGR_PEP_ID=MMETSP1385-20130828/186616_1 /ASSEMBLY_ACC=CAM_ASM_000861 /TAXON_ID=933848 /ORGANISM="Elphidium margaritaceum" /LENGTH=819 /DNA_ID=CAMNT_0049396673 /DNA_START=1421 /DNA_END=3880 /DNA_ORIENTATION=+